MSNVPPAIEAVGMVRRFGEVTALDGVSLVVRPGEYFSLLGPSGCGKTTLLRLIAGLDQPDAGSLRISGTDTAGIPAHVRPVNTVFQSYALFPHLTVRDNIGFGLRMKRVAAAEIERRVAAVMTMVEVRELAARRPAELSGGQKQRVALARAVVNEPKVLLLDEPLAALDLKLRRQLQGELLALQRRLGITFIHVTHDQDEALTLSDRLAVMNHGRVEQLGTPRELYEQPRNRFVAGFLGGCNLIEAREVRRAGDGSWRVASTAGELALPASTAPPVAGTFTVAIRPERVIVDGAPSTGAESPNINLVRGRIEEVTYAGAETQYRVLAGTLTLKAVTMNDGSAARTAGEELTLRLPPNALRVLED